MHSYINSTIVRVRHENNVQGFNNKSSQSPIKTCHGLNWSWYKFKVSLHLISSDGLILQHHLVAKWINCICLEPAADYEVEEPVLFCFTELPLSQWDEYFYKAKVYIMYSILKQSIAYNKNLGFFTSSVAPST